MAYTINSKNIEDGRISFIYEEEALSGVKKIADKVIRDMDHVFGVRPECISHTAGQGLDALGGDDMPCDLPVIFGTVGSSPLLDLLNEKGLIKLDEIRGRREVYSFTCLDSPFENISSAIVIAGSDKRGTVYGLFHISDILNVSPLTDWCDIMPDKMTELTLDDSFDLVSKEPSVKYRGFFINDEWPAFGKWAKKNFGGINARMYEHVFELLLRLKGNYLWPAMWASIFPDDGPGSLSMELADELGVVMGMSHHEPCLRAGEEYKHLRGPESEYGDAWDFRTNEEGITRFWEDGLKRSGRFENVITVGMRGEFDSKILGDDASLKDNIDLLRDVLKTQNRLIRENVNEDLDKAPRMFALYKEVEPFLYGDDFTEGLMDDPELEGVILMLCDDNYGNLRTLPTEHMRDHKGGFGMYYHLDYHGWPVSYEWVNSTPLTKIWDQMTTAYEFGVRDLWIVNVGDIFTNEYPLSYLLDMAYDYDKWGIGNIDSPDEYTGLFVERQFGNSLDASDKDTIADLLKGYTKIANTRRPEAMNDTVYHPVNYGELEELSAKIALLMETADAVSAHCDETNAFTFFQLVGYPLVATLNLTRMWLATAENHYLSDIHASFAMKVAAEVHTRLKLDKALTEQLHELHEGRWYGMGLSEHVGFREWNEEECAFPVLHDFEPSNKNRLIVTIPGTQQHSEGGVWTGRVLTLPDFLDPSCVSARITLYSTGGGEAKYEVINDKPWITFSQAKGTCLGGFYEQIYVKLDREAEDIEDTAEAVIKGEFGQVKVMIPINTRDYSDLPGGTYVWLADHISIEAGHYCASNETEKGRFVELEGHGRSLSTVKAFPVDAYFTAGKDAPSLDYRVYTDNEDEYEIDMYLSPSNPVSRDNSILYAVSSSAGDKAGSLDWEEEADIINAVPEDFRVGDLQKAWAEGVLNNIRISSGRILLRKGVNTVRVYALTPGFILQKMVIRQVGSLLPESYLGPGETYRTR